MENVTECFVVPLLICTHLPMMWKRIPGSEMPNLYDIVFSLEYVLYIAGRERPFGISLALGS